MPAAPIVVFDEIDSTNAEARRRAEAGDGGPVWLLGLRQTAGKGRRGRNWETGEGNLAVTYLFTTSRPPIEAAQISFVAALAVAELAEQLVPKALVALKWPNDLLVAGSKAAGILVESGPSRSGGGLWVAVGIGVNLAKAPEAPERPATALSQHRSAPPPSPGEAVGPLAEAFERWLAVWGREGFAAVAAAWTARAHGLGRPCEARLPGETVSGIAEGLDADGALRLRLPSGGVRRITAGDVFFGDS